MNMPLVLLNRRRRGFTAFSPSTLFALAEPGVWFDPSDLTTLYQDTAGTTPVTTPGQTVGLMLDKSKGLALGAELVANGDFAAGTTGWAATNATLSVVSGQLRVVKDSAATFCIARVEITGLTVGRTYRVLGTFATISLATGTQIWVGTAGGAQDLNLNRNSTTAGSVSAAFVAGAATRQVEFVMTGATGTASVMDIDNISVKELPGNHATQATIAARPTYSIEPVGGRRNLLTWSEDYSNADWLKLNAGTGVTPVVTTNAGAAPDGTVTADRIVFNRGAGTTSADISRIFQDAPDPASGFATSSIYLRSFDGVSTYSVQISNGATSSIVTVTGTWQRFSLTSTTTATNIQVRTQGDITQQTADVLVWGAQDEWGSTATAYQRVTTQYDVTEAGVASLGYLYFDGAGDHMVTSTITPGTDKAQVFAGVRKISDATSYAMVAELGAGSGAHISLMAPYVGAVYGFDSAGTSIRNATSPTTFPAPRTDILTGLGDISGDRTTLRVNGTQVAQNTGDQGTGNYSNSALNIGRRANGDFPFSGHLYSLITRFGANLDATTIASTETWVAGKTGITI